MSRALDETLMRRAIAAARTRLGKTAPKPAVGCVIARGAEVLSEAATGEGGHPHAEEQALAQIGGVAAGAVVYITLEPCAQRSSGGVSCSERLVAAGVARVVIAAENPEGLSAGRGLARLRAAGIVVETGFLTGEAEPLYRAFRYRLETGHPLIEASADGEGFDAPLEVRPGETPSEAVARYGAEGFARLWVETGGPLASRLKELGLLA